MVKIAPHLNCNVLPSFYSSPSLDDILSMCNLLQLLDARDSPLTFNNTWSDGDLLDLADLRWNQKKSYAEISEKLKTHSEEECEIKFNEIHYLKKRQWTKAQDRLLPLLKKAQFTFAEIGAMLNRTGNECQHHFALIIKRQMH